MTSAFLTDGGPCFVPTAILAEIGYLVEHRLGHGVLKVFLLDLETGPLSLECGDEDTGRIRDLVGRYAGMPLGLADAVVIACAERSGGRTMTLDVRHFSVVAREGAITLVP